MEALQVQVDATDVKMDTNREETQADVKWFNGKPSNSSMAAAGAGAAVGNNMDETDKALPTVKFNKHDMYYDMTGEKRLIILNHRNYKRTMYFEYNQPSERNHTEKDVDKLQNTFRNLGFKTVVYNDLKHEDIIKKVSEVSKEDHSATSCIAVAIMTHGDDGSVYAADRPYQLSDVTTILQHGHPSLVGKPKLLFVQACRGDSMDKGRRVQTDGKDSIVLPTHADTLIMYSSAEQHLAYRDSNGSWLMQSLCEVLDDYHGTFELLQMLTLVHQVVAYKSTYTKSAITSNKKMMPETKFTLTKLLKFYD